MHASNDPDDFQPGQSARPGIHDEKYQEALKSTRWFGYIAVGIALASMCAGLAFMARVVYLFFRGL